MKSCFIFDKETETYFSLDTAYLVEVEDLGLEKTEIKAYKLDSLIHGDLAFMPKLNHHELVEEKFRDIY